MKKTCGYKSVNGTIYTSSKMCRKQDLEFKLKQISQQVRNLDSQMAHAVFRSRDNWVGHVGDDMVIKMMAKMMYTNTKELLDYKLEADRLQAEYQDSIDKNTMAYRIFGIKL